MPLWTLCVFHMIFLILWLSLANIKILVIRTLLRFTANTYPIIHVCLLISAQHFCKIKLWYLWVHFIAGPIFVIVENIYKTLISQYTTTNHVPGCIILLSNFPKPYLLVQSSSCGGMCYHPFSWISERDNLVIPSDHVLVSQLFICMKSFMSLQWYFRVDTW